MENDSPILVEIQTGKEGPSHTKEIAEQIGFPFKPFPFYYTLGLIKNM